MSGTKVKLVQIDQHKAGQRIDNFLLGVFVDVPKSRIYRALRSGEVRVNKRRIKPVYRLQEGDQVRLPPIQQQARTKQTSIPRQACEQLEDCIIKEDEHILVINKPAGLAAHAGTGDKFGVIEILRASREYQPYLELAHRIDKATSGCLILAKSRRALLDIQNSLQSEASTKRYICLVKGKWQVKNYVVDHALEKSTNQHNVAKVKISENGMYAQTIFSTIKMFSTCSLMNAQIVTGRTHQIRVHAQVENHPIAGDSRYGDFAFNKQLQKIGLQRMFLHCAEIRVHLRDLSQSYQFAAPLAKELKQLSQRLENVSED